MLAQPLLASAAAHPLSLNGGEEGASQTSLLRHPAASASGKVPTRVEAGDRRQSTKRRAKRAENGTIEERKTSTKGGNSDGICDAELAKFEQYIRRQQMRSGELQCELNESVATMQKKQHQLAMMMEREGRKEDGEGMEVVKRGEEGMGGVITELQRMGRE